MSQIGHIKIAITTNSLTRADVSFAAARQVVFYDVSYDSSEFLDVVSFAPRPPSATVTELGKTGVGRNGGACMAGIDDGLGGDPLAVRVGLLEGCAIVFTMGLSDPAAIRLRDARIFPVKMETSREIDEIIALLQHMMNHTPPLWLRKALGYGRMNLDYLLGDAA